MLRPRSKVLTLVRSVLYAGLDRAAAADPGLIRLMLASRGTVSVFLTSVAAILVSRLGGWSVTEFATAVTFSIMGPFLMSEPTLRQRQITLLVLALPAAAAATVTSLLHSSGMIGDSFFLVLVFVCFLVHPLSRRNIGIGLVAVVMTYVGLFLELPPATIPVQLAALVGALPIIAFACFVVLPMNPVRTLRRLVDSVQARAAHVLRRTSALTRPGRARGILWSALRRDLLRLNEAALAADDQLTLVMQASDGTAVRRGLMDVELSTARLIHTFDRETAGPRSALRLQLHERRIRRGGAYAMEADMLQPGTVRAELVSLGRAVHALGKATRRATPGQYVQATPPAPGPLAWRIATRVTLAAGLAMAGGIAVSPQRWFWAVMTVYVVFLNARSRGDTIYKGIQRVGGTLLGIMAGVLLTAALGRDPWLEATVLLLSVFGMYYFILLSYTAGIFCLTIMLGLLYGMLGASASELLVLRFEETAIGAIAAVVVALFVFPARTRDQVMRSGRSVLASLAAAVGTSRRALEGQADVSPLAAMRQVDRSVADLRLALLPLTAGRRFRRSALERPVPALLDCVHWTRMLASVASNSGASNTGAGNADVVQLASAIEQALAALAEGGRTAEPPAPSSGTGDAADTLDRLASCVATLRERLQIGTLEGFAMDA